MHPISRPCFCGPHSPIDEWARSGPRRRATIWGTWPPNLSSPYCPRLLGVHISTGWPYLSSRLVAVDPIVYTTCWPVRHYELDRNGHVNNAVYLNYAEQLTIEHAELAGFGAEWSAAHGGWWVVYRSVLTYHRPAVYGDLLELTVRVELVQGTRGIRRTTIRRAADGEPVAEVLT